MRKLAQILSLLLALAMALTAGAQTFTLDNFPAELQLVPRSSGAETAPLVITGSVTAAEYPVGRLTAKLTTADGELVEQRSIDLDEPPAQDTGRFSLTVSIPVTRADHTVTLSLDRTDGSREVLAEAERIVAGDVYVVNGQSNAEAHARIHPDDRDPFLRGYNGPEGDPGHPGWTELRYARGGYWAGRAANRLSEELDVPIAVFNFALGGQPLDFFEVGSPSGNYLELTSRLATAGVRDEVAAFFWFQGEADGFDTSVRSYRSRLAALLEAYRAALGIEEVVLFQVRPYTCFATSPNIAEAQRRMAAADGGLLPLATTNVRQRDDGCHFEYEGGYALIGERVADLLRQHVYGLPLSGTTSPDVDSARVTGRREVTAYLDVPGSSLAVTGAPWSDFVAEGLGAVATGGQVVGDRVVLEFDVDVAGATGLSYRGRSDTTLNYLHNARGVGALLWHDISLVPGDGAPGRPADLRLGLEREGERGSLAAGESADLALTVTNHGGTTLTDAVVEVALPPSLSYPDVGDEVYRGRDATLGRFDGTAGRWVVPTLRPGTSATLTFEVVAGQGGASSAVVWAQAVAQDQPDADSEVADGRPGQVRADDEVRLVLGRPEDDCGLDVALAGAACERTGGGDRWVVEFAPARAGGASLTHTLTPAAPLVSDGSGGRVVVDMSAWYESGAAEVVVEVARPAGALACLNAFVLAPPAECGAPDGPPDSGAVTIDTSRCCGLVVRCDAVGSCDTTALAAGLADSLRGDLLASTPGTCDTTVCRAVGVSTSGVSRQTLQLSPNPAVPGGAISGAVPLPARRGERLRLYDATGKALEVGWLSQGSRRFEVRLPPHLPPGLYVLRAGRAAARLLVE